MAPDTFSATDIEHLLQALRELAGELAITELLPAIARITLAHTDAALCRVHLDPEDGAAMQVQVGDPAAISHPALRLPLVHAGKALGQLLLYPATPTACIGSRAMQLAQWIAAHAAQGVAHALVHEQLCRTSQALSTSHELLRQGERFNHTGSMRYLVRQDLMICSDELCRIYGLPAGQTQISYEEFAALMHPDDRNMVIETVEGAVAIGGTIRLQHRIRRHDNGEVRYISGIGKPNWVAGTFTEYIGTATDITARRQAELAMRVAEADLARVSRATTVGQLTASIAHEVNQPLMSIVSNAGASLRWLDREPPQLDNARAGLRDIIAEGRRAGGMIAGLQNLTRNTEPVFKRLDLNATITHILALSRGEMERREVTLQLALMPGEAWVLGDAVQLQQVMLNLVLNAIEAMAPIQDRGRVLAISTEVHSEQRVLATVRDNGEGISEEAMPRVFDAFYTTKENGMGMGLPICRSIVEAHHGRLAVTAAEGGGTVFRFELPQAH